MLGKPFLHWQHCFRLLLFLGIAWGRGGGNFLSAQEPNFQHYTVKEGLASMTIYQVMQDREGLIWLATENGLNVFDGYEFRRIGVADGLPDNDVLGLKEDSQGRIWIIPTNGAFAYLEGGEIVSGQQAPWIPSLTDIPVIHDELSDGRLAFGSKNRLVVADPRGMDTLIWKEKVNYVQDLGAGKLGHLWEDGTLRPFSKYPVTIDNPLPELPPSWLSWLDKLYGRVLKPEQRIHLKRRSNFFAEALAQVQADCGDCQLNHLYESRDSSLWISTNGSGVYRALPGQPPGHFLDGTAVSGVTQDWGGNFWLSTLGQGLYFLPAQGLEVLTLRQAQGLCRNQVLSLAADEAGRLYIGYDRAGVSCRLPNGKLVHHLPQMLSRDKDRITDLDVLPGGDLLVGTDRGSVLIQDPSTLQHPNDQEDARAFTQQSPQTVRIAQRYTALGNIAVKAQQVLPDGSIYLTANGRVEQCQLDGDRYDCQAKTWPWGYALLWQPKTEELWVASQRDLRLCQGDSCLVPDFQAEIRSRITVLEAQAGGGVWIGTSGNGLFYHDGQDLYQLSGPPTLPSSVINCLLSDGSDGVWVGTDRGLALVHWESETGQLQVTEDYGFQQGLADDFINDVAQTDSVLWVATPNGLSRLPLSQSRPHLALPKLELAQVRILERDTVLQSKFALSHWQNSVSVLVRDPQFTAVRYQYRLLGSEAHWLEMNGPKVEFPRLAPGNTYQLEIRAANARGEWSESLGLGFEISQVFYRSLWFWLLLAGGIWALLLTAFIFWRRHRERLRHRELLYQQRLAQMRLSALKSQMNPHFLFNSLNSIQHLITEQEGRTATRFVAKFSRLMRRVLDHSNGDFISLREELDVCRLYLELESMRLMDNFQYEIEWEPAIDLEQLMIPSMLLQPFLENAIWHGLMPKQGDRRLWLKLSRKGKVLCCAIEDNGIGRQAAQVRQEQSEPDYVSRAIGIFEERLDLLNQGFAEGAFAYLITDLPQGTRIEITLPVLQGNLSSEEMTSYSN